MTPASANIDNLTAVGVGVNEIDLTWELNTIGAQAIEVDRSDDGSTWTAITTTLPGTTLGYADTSVSENSQYYYRVRAIYPDTTTSAFTNVADAYSLPAITGLAASAASATEIDLSWTLNITNATAIEVDASPDGSTWTTLTSTLDPTATAYADTALSESTHYYYRVHAITSGATSEEPAYADATTLAAVDSLSATAASTSEIDLSWSVNVSDATATEIDRSSDGGTTWAVLTSTLDPATTTYTDTGLDDNTDYTYQVRVIRPGGDSAYTAPTDAVTVADISGLTATPDVFGGAIDLAWTLNATGITTLSIYRATDGGAYSLLTDSISTSATTYSDSTVVEGHDYSYELQATFSDGVGNFSDPADASAAPIQNLVAVPDTDTTGVTLNWFNFSPFATSIEVDYSTDDVTFTALTTSLDGSATSYDATGLTTDAEYYFQLKITDGAGTTISGVVDTWTLPPAPTALTSTSATPTEVDLDWTNNASSTDPVFIERSDDGGTDYAIIDQVSGTTASYQDTSVIDGTNYVYQVDAVAGDGFDANPTTSTVAVFAPLAAPTQLTLTQNGPNEIDLSWSNPSQSATGYIVQRSTNGTDFSDIGTIAYADDSFYSDTGLSAGTQYYYRVEATDADSDLSSTTAIATTVTSPGLSIPTTNASTVYEGSTYTLSTSNIIPTGEVDPITGWIVNWGDGNTTNASGLANGDPGSFTHIYITTGFYTITASTIDGSFSGTQNVEAEYGSADDRIALTSSISGMSASVSATYTDPAGHHVNTWVVSWGDGTIQTYGSSDSSTDGTDTDPTSTDTKAFTHTYPDTPDYDYDVSITAVTDENVYQSGTVAAVSTDASWTSDTLSAGTQSSDEETYPTPIDGISDAEVTISDATPGNFTVDWGDTTDGSDDATFYSADSTVISPAHTYAQAGTYIVTITETPDDDGPTLTGHAFMPIAAGTPTMSTINDQVLAAGAALGITEDATAASGDPLFATIEFDNGTAPRVVPITDGAIDLTAVDAPSNFVGDQASDGVSTAVDAYNAAAQGCMGQQSFLTDAWSVQLDNGESNDLLIASSDGTQNLQPVMFYFPRPSGEAIDVTMTSSDYSQNLLWDTSTPNTLYDTPVLGPSTSSCTITLSPYTTSVERWSGANAGNTTPGVQSFSDTAICGTSDSTSTFLTQLAAGGPSVPLTGTGLPVPTSQPTSQGGWQIDAYRDPNGVTAEGANVAVATPRNWLVGEVAQLRAFWSGPGVAPTGGQWSISGDDVLFGTLEKYGPIVDNHLQSPTNYRKVIPLADDNGLFRMGTSVQHAGLLQNSLVFFWVAASQLNTPTTSPVSFDSLTVTYTPKGAPPVATHFNLYSPITQWNAVAAADDPKAEFVPRYNAYAIGLVPEELTNPAGKRAMEGILWSAAVDQPPGFATGQFKYIQKVTPITVKVNYGGATFINPFQGFTVLDTTDPYEGIEPAIFDTATDWHSEGDAPMVFASK